MRLANDASVGNVSSAAPPSIFGEEYSCLSPTPQFQRDDPDVQRLVILLARKLGWKGFVPAAIGMEGTLESFCSASAYVHANLEPRKASAAASGKD